MFESRVLKKTFGHNMEKVKGGWRNLQNVELRNMLSSWRIISMMKSMGINVAGHLAHTGENRRS